MKCRDEFPNWRTENQWLKEGYVLRPEAKGEEFWTNRNYQKSAWYYPKNQVRNAPVKAKHLIQSKNKADRERRKIEKEKEKRLIEYYEDLRASWNTRFQWEQLGRRPNKDAPCKLGSDLNGRYRPFGDKYCYYHLMDTHIITEENEKE